MPASLGKYYDQVNLGRVFIGNTAAAGVALPVETGTAVTFGLWNTTPNMKAVPLWMSIAYVSGTITVGGFVISNQAVGYAVGTPLTAITTATPKNALLGSGNSSQMTFTGSTATLAAGGTRCYSLGLTHEIATAGPGVSPGGHDFDGRLVVMPGQIIFPAFSIAQTGVFSISMAWAEVPIGS
jgi:hypothetical protein